MLWLILATLGGLLLMWFDEAVSAPRDPKADPHDPNKPSSPENPFGRDR